MRLSKVLILMLMLVATACTHHNGDIGPLFGEWAVDDVTVSGKRVDDYPYGHVYWKFQSDIVVLLYTRDYHDNPASYIGLWTREGNLINMDFRQIVDPDSPMAIIPAALLVPYDSDYEIREESSHRLQLALIDTDGEPVVFTMRKIN